MKLRLETPDGRGLSGFPIFWGKRVLGFSAGAHCAQCLLGDWLRFLRPGMAPGEHEFPEGDLFYICGVSSGGYWANLHMPLRRIDGAEARVEAAGGAVLTATDAHLLEIPGLPAGWNELDESFTTCRNFQWAAATFGYPPELDGKAVAKIRRADRERKRAKARRQVLIFP